MTLIRINENEIQCDVCNVIRQYDGDITKYHHTCLAKHNLERHKRFVKRANEIQKRQKKIIGVGSEVKRILSKLFIRPTKGCPCERRAAIMDHEGPDWCEQNMDTIIGWLKEEADKRKIVGKLFSETVARELVKLAIKRTRKKIKKAESTIKEPEYV